MTTPKVDLTDESVHPNPEIKALLNTSQLLFNLAMSTTKTSAISILYTKAYEQTNTAIETLFSIKNLIASKQGESGFYG